MDENIPQQSVAETPGDPTTAEKPAGDDMAGKPAGEVADKLAACEKLRDEYLDGWKRAKADSINYKKEEARRFEYFAKFGTESLVGDFLIILDSFDLGTAALDDKNPAKQGMRLIQSQLEEVLKRQGLERIQVAAGERFDPSKHEAVSDAPSDDPPETIIQEVGKGYTMHGKVIRPARVIISKGQL